MDENNLEVFRLIRFDSNFTIFDDPQLDKRLFLIINHIKKFIEINECLNFPVVSDAMICVPNSIDFDELTIQIEYD